MAEQRITSLNPQVDRSGDPLRDSNRELASRAEEITDLEENVGGYPAFGTDSHYEGGQTNPKLRRRNSTTACAKRQLAHYTNREDLGLGVLSHFECCLRVAATASHFCIPGAVRGKHPPGSGTGQYFGSKPITRPR
jgi:hypothetical protein